MRVTRINTFVALLVAAILIAGCSETVSVRSGPSGAVVYLDGKPIGTTPLDYSLPRSEVGEPHRVRVEKTGYAPVESDLRTRWAKGRVTGAVFTLGLLALIRPMRSVDPVFAELEPLHRAQEDQDRRVGEALRNLRELHRSGRISDDELRQRQEELLREGNH